MLAAAIPKAIASVAPTLKPFQYVAYHPIDEDHALL
jgi:hypothetical protein